MEHDVRLTPEGKAVWEFYSALYDPGSGKPYSAADLAPLASGEAVVLTGLAFEGALEDGPSAALYCLDTPTPVLISPSNR